MPHFTWAPPVSHGNPRQAAGRRLWKPPSEAQGPPTETEASRLIRFTAPAPGLAASLTSVFRVTWASRLSVTSPRPTDRLKEGTRQSGCVWVPTGCWLNSDGRPNPASVFCQSTTQRFASHHTTKTAEHNNLSSKEKKKKKQAANRAKTATWSRNSLNNWNQKKIPFKMSKSGFCADYLDPRSVVHFIRSALSVQTYFCWVTLLTFSNISAH